MDIALLASYVYPMANTLVAIASDHAGFELKSQLIEHFKNVAWTDLGTQSTASTDYPKYADLLAEQVVKHNLRGILICGSGIGMSIRANRFHKIRAALCYSEEGARLAREHNNANVLCLGSRMTPLPEAIKIVETFLNTEFAGGRHEARVNQLDFPSDLE